MIPLRVLLIEDSSNDAALVVAALSAAGYAVTSERVETPEALSAALARQPWNVAIADFTMPGFTGTAALSLLRAHDAQLPFIFVSGTIGEDAAVAAMKAGAHDYIMKGNLKRLAPAVARELREAAGRIARRQAEAQLVHLAYHDTLTGLPNRVLLHDRLEQAIRGAQRTEESLALLVLDLDGFKAINDSWGHQAGDLVLREMAGRLRTMLRDVDTVARLGGDEFALMLPRTSRDGATAAARKVLRAFSRPFALDGRPVVIAGSLGIASFPEHGATSETLLQHADIAMYAAKSTGTGYAAYTPGRDRHARTRLALATEFRKAIERGRFSCDYEPIVHLRTGRVLCVEALARWHHPTRGTVPPGQLVELAKQVSLIEPLTLSVLDRALGDWAGRDRLPRVSITVNLPSEMLRRPELPDRIAALLRLHHASPTELVLEVSEHDLLTELPKTAALWVRFHGMGLRLAIDSFGTGHASVTDLRSLPVDRLKIDRSLVTALTFGDSALVQSTIDLAHHLGLTAVADGVESQAARDRLLALGCDAAQGPFMAKTGSAADVRRWIMQQNL